MAALNFPDPNVTTTYTNPDTGITYEWSNNTWKAIRSAQTAPELFVDYDGDNMTGDLTFNTDKIVLGATFGTGTFAGDLSTGTFSPGSTTTTGTSVLASGQINVQQASGSNGYFTRGFQGNAETYYVKSDGSASFASGYTFFNEGYNYFKSPSTGNSTLLQIIDGNDSANVTFKANGSAVFSGTIQSTAGGFTFLAGSGTASSDNFVYLTPGQTYVNRTDNTSAALNLALSGSVNTSLNADGSAEFAGGAVEIRSTGETVIDRTSSGNGCLSVRLNGTESGRINADGSATFGNRASTGDWSINPTNGIRYNSGSAEEIILDTNGSAIFKAPTSYGVKSQASGGNDGQKFPFVGTNSSGTTTFSVDGDGSANFATQLVTGSANSVTSTSSHGSYIGEGIVVNAIQPNATLAAQERVWLGKLANVTKSQIFKDGSASFTGAIAVGTTPQDNIGKVFITESPAVTGKTLLALGDGNAVNGKLKSDGSAEFDGTVSSPNWDVTTSANGFYLNKGAAFIHKASGAPTSSAFAVYYGGGTNQTASIKADGSASFDGVLTGNQRVVINQAGGKTGSAHTLLNYAGDGTTVTASFTADGSATFAARLSPGTTSLNDHAIVALNNNAENGTIVIQNMNNSGSLLQGYNGSSSKNVDITAGGAASFGIQNLSSDGGAGTAITGDGRMSLQFPSGGGAGVEMFSLYSGTSKTISMLSGGSATFAGDVTAQDAFISNRTTSSAVCFSGMLNGATNVDIRADGSATFKGQMTLDGDRLELIVPSTSDTAWRALQGGSVVASVMGDGSAEFAGAVTLSSGSDTNLFLTTTNSTAHNRINFTNSASSASGGLWYGSGDTMEFRTDDEERMRLSSAGELFVNSTSKIGSGLVSISFTTNHNAISIKPTSSILNQNYLFFLNSVGSVAGYIRQTGTTTTFFGTSSDYRLKENVVNISDGITRVKQLQPRRFNFIDDADTTVDGFLAHEAQTVVPEAVSGTHNEVDDDGNAVMQGIDQAKMVPLLTAALQEAIAKIETLEAKVAALEAG